MQYRAAFSIGLVVMMMTVTACGTPLSKDLVPNRNDDRRSPNVVHAGPDRRSLNSVSKKEKLLKILTSLEEIQKSINSTLNSKITLMTRANVRGSGKKAKVVMPLEVLRTTTLPPMDDGGTSSQANGNSHNHQGQGSKELKKSASQSPKKPNKRVCFWKYCSQN